MPFFFPKTFVPVALLVAILNGCGGGNDNEVSDATGAMVANTVRSMPGAPQATGDTAVDGFNWFNFRRTQAGLTVVGRNGIIDVAAQGHSAYQAVNNVISHEQTPGSAKYTGATLGERLTSAGYRFNGNGYMYGEIISRTSYTSGARAAEELIAAIYHRFVALEPMLKEAGVATATSTNGLTYFTTNFAASGLDRGLPVGEFVAYPFDGQKQVAISFLSDNELPDPVPSQNEVGYPISIHANVTSRVELESFTVQPRGGAPLAVRLLTAKTDSYTPMSAASIIPSSPLAPTTTYDVTFRGVIDNRPVSRSWSFTTVGES